MPDTDKVLPFINQTTPQLSTAQAKQFGSTNPYNVPVDASGNAYRMNYSDNTMNQNNQNLLSKQMAAQTAGTIPTPTGEGSFLGNAWDGFKGLFNSETAAPTFAQQQAMLGKYNTFLETNPMGTDGSMTLEDFTAKMNEGQNQGFGVMDAVGLGMGAFNMYTNYTGQKEALDQNQQSLDLSKEKFAFLKQKHENTRAASKRNLISSSNQASA